MMSRKVAVTKISLCLLYRLLFSTLVMSPVLSIPQMNNPAIQNDLSYYRRTRNRLKMEDGSAVLANGGDIGLPDDVGNRMSLFYANPTPMLNTISTATTKFTQEVKYMQVCCV